MPRRTSASMSQKESSEKSGFRILECPSARAAMMSARLVTLLEPGTRIVASGGLSNGVTSSSSGKVGRTSSTVKSTPGTPMRCFTVGPQLTRREGSVLTLGEVSDGDGTNTRPVQGDQRQPDSHTGSTYYAVTALVDGHLEGGRLLGAPEVRDFGGVHLAVFEARARCKGGEGVSGDGVFEGKAVLFIDL